ncbi:MAG: hypothetical protein P8J18_04640 [Halieaceae bacterium]|nr:hypothetical protein [Halieaceae bacterium]
MCLPEVGGGLVGKLLTPTLLQHWNGDSLFIGVCGVGQASISECHDDDSDVMSVVCSLPPGATISGIEINNLF